MNTRVTRASQACVSMHHLRELVMLSLVCQSIMNPHKLSQISTPIASVEDTVINGSTVVI